MGFYKKIQQKINKLWYPRTITIGKPITTDQVADKLAAMSTVSRGDTYAVLKNLGVVLGDYMGQGYTVKLEGIGTFYYTGVTTGNGVDSPDKVKASHITNVRVRFIPETEHSSSGKIVSRSLVGNNVHWEEWGGSEKKEPGDDPGVVDPTA